MSFQREVQREVRCAHDSGHRDVKDITLLVLHDTEGDTAAGAASWFANPASEGSAHLTGDGETLIRCAPNDVITWGVADVNSEALHYEMAGVRAGWDRRLWLTRKSRRIYHQAAYRMARWSVEYDVSGSPPGGNKEPRFRTTADLNRMRTLNGITLHANLSASHHSSSTHTDPGKGFPVRRFMRAFRRYRKQLRNAH